MKSIIESTLATHWRASVTIDDLDPWYECQCGHRQLSRSSAHGSTSTWQAAHQARAVLDAISEAGAVEWGIRYGDGDIDGGYLHKSEALTDIARLRERVRLGYDSADEHEPMTLLTRRRVDHATDWVSAE